MQEKILREIVLNIAGKQASDIVNILIGKKNVNEFLIAKKLNLTINQVRNILYKLSDNGLASFTRKKDRKKGWYTYFWTLENEKSLLFIRKQLNQELDTLLKQLKSRENKVFYVCNTCIREVSEENALLTHFTCQECGQVYELSDANKKIKELNSRIDTLKRQVKIIDNELDKIGVKKKKIEEKAKKKEVKTKKKKVKTKKKEVKTKKKEVKTKKKPTKTKKKEVKTKKKKPIKKTKKAKKLKKRVKRKRGR